MLSSTEANIVISLMFGLGVSAAVLGIVILRRGKLYHRLDSEERPRRWVLISLLVLLAVFVVWFPVWMTWPHAMISRVLTLLFGIVFGVLALSLKWFAPLIDWYIKRKGWPLR